MAGKRIEMKDVHSIVLMLSQGYGTKHISAVLGCARNTVKAYRAIIASKGLTYEELLTRPEEELEGFFTSKKPEEDDRMGRLEDAFKNADGELGKVGVTKFLLWNEYRLSNPDGYSYPQFCKLYRERAETVDVSMHIEHKPGDKLYIDYTGKKIPYVDRSTGEVKDAEIFLTSLGYSEYTYVEASPSQAQECFAESLRHALECYGGVPQVLVPDNLKSAVKTADKYEAEINALLATICSSSDAYSRFCHPVDAVPFFLNPGCSYRCIVVSVVGFHFDSFLFKCHFLRNYDREQKNCILTYDLFP